MEVTVKEIGQKEREGLAKKIAFGAFTSEDDLSAKRYDECFVDGLGCYSPAQVFEYYPEEWLQEEVKNFFEMTLLATKRLSRDMTGEEIRAWSKDVALNLITIENGSIYDEDGEVCVWEPYEDWSESDIGKEIDELTESFSGLVSGAIYG